MPKYISFEVDEVLMSSLPMLKVMADLKYQ